MLNLFHDLRLAARMMRRNPGFTAAAMLALGLGIGANTAVFTVVHGVLLRTLPFPQADRLYFLTSTPTDGPFGPPRHTLGGGIGIADRAYLEAHDRIQSFSPVAVFDSAQPAALAGAAEPVRVGRSGVTREFLDVLGVRPAIGSLPDGNAVLLSDHLWRTHFAADRGVIGKVVTLDGVAHTVTGVMPAGFAFPPDTDLWTPETVRIDSHNSFTLNVIGRLKPGVEPQRAQAELQAVLESPQGFLTEIIPLKDVVIGESRRSLLVFLGAVVFVLLIACANVANLLLMRASTRRQEVAVRVALGAGRWRLIRQLLTESLALSTGGGVLGMLVALWALPALLALAPAGKIPRLEEIHIDATALAFTVALAIGTGIVFGLAPAFQATQLRDVVAPGSRTATGRHEGLRGALVVAEMAIALMLLAGAGLLLKSFLRIRAVDPGFHADHLLTVTVDLPPFAYGTLASLHDFHQRMLARLSALPGASAVAAVNFRPLGHFLAVGDFQMDGGRKRPRGFLVAKPTISAGYFRAMGIRLVAGREFNERDDASAPGVIIVTRKVARTLWPNEDPLGQRLSMADKPKAGDWLTVVGVVDDIRQQNLKEATMPAIYQPYPQIALKGFLDHMTFVVRTPGDPASLSLAMRRALREVDPGIPPQSLATMQALVAETTAEPLFQTRLLAAFSLVALALAAFGIYAVLAYSVEQRTREIGIRMALGAAAGDVARMVLRRAAALIATGLAVGAAGALAVTRVLSAFLFQVKPTDAETAVAVALLLSVVALIAGWLPARRAARLDPLVALRYE